MEPVHYVRAFRRRWWVIVAAILVAEAVAWVTVPNARSSAAPAVSHYSATTILWNTGASTSGQPLPITSLDALVTVATLPAVAEIAAKRLNFDGKPADLATQVQATVDDNHFFLSIKATATDPKRAVAISTAFSQALVRYLQQLTLKSNDQQQANLQEQIDKLQQQGADPTVIDPLKQKLSQLAVDRSAPVPISTLQVATAVPASAPVTATTGFQAPRSRAARLLLAGLIGLLCGLVLALILERFDSKIRTRRVAEDALGLPVLAEVPGIPRRQRKRVVTATDPISRPADAFRLLSAGIARWSFNTNGRANGNGHVSPSGSSLPTNTILVTSPEARDGKTMVAANLAAAYAETGKRVLVVSCNFRRSTINKMFGVPNGPGLVGMVDALDQGEPEGSVDLGSYVEPCSVVRIAVLPSGATPQRPAELLGSSTMRHFLEVVKKKADVVILDCASMQVASDVAPLLPQVDAVVLVVRAGKTGIELAKSTENLLQRLGANVVGLVLNDAKEFSIPVARRRLYRRTRQMAKVGAANGDRGRDKTEGSDGTQRDMWAGIG